MKLLSKKYLPLTTMDAQMASIVIVVGGGESEDQWLMPTVS